ncbi:fibronectin type III domain-containing protein [uncultured Aquimarina sp.]|uniref:fibronectin type III domain-containing protein n=1 Tax=uncultured Aquimarina sp. TaxID=575652 RepID=UPI002625A125|nr:fibronectin type III domain-containing protein [uncultured Aquimarina sp.]
MKKLLLILIALVQVTFALAQSFPVRVTPQAIPPYPTNLSGYANSGLMNSPLRVQLVLSDVTASSREVRLAVSIEGNGINATSAPVVIGAPTLILDGGIPLNLTVTELAPYFEQQNLQGLSSVQYNNPLQDGMYRFCFEVFDAFNGNRLSSKSCATVFLINNDPPFLNKPDNESKISEQNPTNILFQWTPRHINVPNVSYEFSIVEVWDTYIDPQAIFLSSPPLYQEVTTNTSLLYGPIQPLLLAGKRYAWRVRAIATNNGEEVSVFNNNGNSEIFWFDYQGNCELPTSIEVRDVSMTNATISWIGHPEHLDYTVQYREAGSTRWYKKTTPRDYVTIDEFKPDTIYEYRIVGNCTENSFGESPVDTFRTLSEEMAEYANCGIDPDPVDLSNQELLTELFVNDVFTAGDFPVYVKEVSGSGSFSGEGYISTPWLATVRIPIKFQNIKINTDMKLVDGFVVTTYDPNWGSIVDADVIIDTITGDDGDTQEITVDMDIVDIQIDDNGDIILIGDDGTVSDPIPGGNDILFHDNNNEDWFVDADGNITTAEQAEGGSATAGNTNGIGNGGVNEITASGVTVTFNNTNGYYSFDTAPENAGGNIANQYDKVPISGGGEYNIPYKAIAALSSHPTDFLTAEASFSNNDHTASDIIFKTKEGTKVQAVWDTDSTVATLSLKKTFDFAKQQIIAAVKPKDSTAKYTVAGAANLWHLANQDVTRVNVKLISVNGASLSGIGERINQIYNPAGVQFNVTSATPISISDTSIDVGDSSLLSQYTEGEKAWISQFKTVGDYQKDTYYLFVTDIPPSDTGTEGFMPLKRQFGFIFPGDDKGRTAAHELGHGVFGLEHPFTEYNTTGTTDLLMDYGTGTILTHMDWEKLHAPGIQIYWFQGDEDGELGGKVWLTPDWKPFSFDSSRTVTGNSNQTNIPQGAVPGIKFEDKHYLADGANFSGYVTNDGTVLSISEKTLSNDSEVYLYRDNGGCGTDTYYKTTWGYIKDKKNNFSFTDNSNVEFKAKIPCPGTNSNENSGCDQFDYLDENNEEHKDLITFYQKEVDNALNNALSSITSTQDTILRSKGVYSHVRFANSKDLPVSKNEIEVLEDKLHLLSYHKKDTYMVVTFLKIKNNLSYLNHQINDLAQRSITNNQSSINGKKIVHVIVTFSDYESIFGVGFANNDSCYNVGFAQSENGIVTNNSVLSDRQSVFKDILEVYKYIEKPLYVKQFFMKADKSMVETMLKSNNISGYESIQVLQFFESKYVSQIKNIRAQISSLIANLDDHASQQDWQDFIEQYQQYKNQTIELYARAEYDEIDIDLKTNSSTWNYYQPDNLVKLREVYIISPEISRAYFVSQTASFGYGQKFQVYFGFNATLDSDTHFYDFDGYSVIDPLVYGIADGLSLIPIPYVDSVGDGMGFIYASARGDMSQAPFYAAGLALPVGAAYLKFGKKGVDNFFAVVAKKTEDGDIVLSTKRIKDIDPDEVQVTSVLSDKASDAQKTLAEVEKHKDKFAKHFDNVANDITALSSKLNTAAFSGLKTEFDKLSQVLKNQFLRDFADADDLLLLINKDGFEIFSSWKNFRTKYPDVIICTK